MGSDESEPVAKVVAVYHDNGLTADDQLLKRSETTIEAPSGVLYRFRPDGDERVSEPIEIESKEDARWFDGFAEFKVMRTNPRWSV
ncbi:hypothetical protein ACERIT_08980 [Halopenitus sp. H-Gu1]|uniref:hypothetical protein n=1 Tax=Halopenitus sp. H-Gu1 TaxID=3242697 RepID=UPI00359DFB60